MVVTKQTFDSLNQNSSIISVSGLCKMLQALGMDSRKPLKTLREEITALAKLVNNHAFHKMQQVPDRFKSDLNFEGFLDFLLQATHRFFNYTVEANQFEAFKTKYALKAYELLDKLFSQIKTVSKTLNLPKQYFEQDSEAQGILEILS